MKDYEKQIRFIHHRIEEILEDDKTAIIFSCDDVVDIFKHYYEVHEEYTGKQHFRLHPSQIHRIILKMAECEDMMHDGVIYLEPEDYPPMIEDYYEKYDIRNNNSFYKPNIEHFFAGKIRALCYYESCY